MAIAIAPLEMRAQEAVRFGGMAAVSGTLLEQCVGWALSRGIHPSLLPLVAYLLSHRELFFSLWIFRLSCAPRGLFQQPRAGCLVTDEMSLNKNQDMYIILDMYTSIYTTHTNTWAWTELNQELLADLLNLNRHHLWISFWALSWIEASPITIMIKKPLTHTHTYQINKNTPNETVWTRIDPFTHKNCWASRSKYYPNRTVTKLIFHLFKFI